MPTAQPTISLAPTTFEPTTASPTITASPTTMPIGRDDMRFFFFCGTSWGDASSRCYKQCLSGHHSECPDFEQVSGFWGHKYYIIDSLFSHSSSPSRVCQVLCASRLSKGCHRSKETSKDASSYNWWNGTTHSLCYSNYEPNRNFVSVCFHNKKSSTRSHNDALVWISYFQTNLRTLRWWSMPPVWTLSICCWLLWPSKYQWLSTTTVARHWLFLRYLNIMSTDFCPLQGEFYCNENSVWEESCGTPTDPPVSLSPTSSIRPSGLESAVPSLHPSKTPPTRSPAVSGSPSELVYSGNNTNQPTESLGVVNGTNGTEIVSSSPPSASATSSKGTGDFHPDDPAAT